LCFFFFTSGSPNASTFNCLITACSCSDGAILESVSRSALRLDFSDGGSSVGHRFKLRCFNYLRFILFPTS
jgi:hypothetical protein